MRPWRHRRPARRHREQGHRASVGSPRGAASLARIGADPRDDEELRQKKALLVLIAVLILPVSVVFARTRRFHPFLVTQLLDILFTTTTGQMLVGGFLPSGGVGPWGILAPTHRLADSSRRAADRDSSRSGP
jgi:hypothetical protein